MPAKGEALKFSYSRVCSATNRAAFRCGERDIDDWFRSDALKCEERGTVRVMCAHLAGNDAPVGFFAIATAVEQVSKLPGYHYHLFGGAMVFPCLQLVYVGVHKELQGRGIGSTMVGSAIALFSDVAPLIGLPHLILIPINEGVKPFYERLGFECYDRGERMFLPIQSAIAAVEAERPT